ncbi:MAG: nuclear transport factor 2 family protein [Alphaproteobacteria bacterium]|nr:nuclear transport factor 2 family protein [Alphaproteobacteria bacterium]MBU1515081.1 nuclear transport factor 2 family protein [Alphaproteobacteria bacterium]MBU2093439.1 nuclear transport factor 2 family protein [Alphaproteobacteria bacterium]MBU2152287.1 nuclear transport factor 2 family protein [Alphaproteobacteria bacterium]MBU2308101.1 nuclear transport factor 2 family protein [Alphaproteobacteria bacterium]
MTRSTEIREAVERYAKAWAAGDMAGIVACYGEDFTLHYAGANALSGDHVGKAQALAVLAEFAKRTGRRLVRIVDVLAGTERGVVIAHEALGPPDARVEVERVLVYRVDAGLFAECWVHDQDQSLIDRLVGKA